MTVASANAICAKPLPDAAYVALHAVQMQLKYGAILSSGLATRNDMEQYQRAIELISQTGRWADEIATFNKRFTPTRTLESLDEQWMNGVFATNRIKVETQAFGYKRTQPNSGVHSAKAQRLNAVVAPDVQAERILRTLVESPSVESATTTTTEDGSLPSAERHNSMFFRLWGSRSPKNPRRTR